MQLTSPPLVWSEPGQHDFAVWAINDMLLKIVKRVGFVYILHCKRAFLIASGEWFAGKD